MESKDKTKITFHSGVLTIGGTVIEIEYSNSSVIFDFGTEYKPELVLKDETLETLIENRLIPNLKHIYYKEILETDELDEHTDKETAVFLSHVHLDHTRMINYLNEKIPLYTTPITKELLHLLNKNRDFLLPLPYDDDRILREINTLEPNKQITIGEIEVEFFPVDHDAYGAVGMLIKTPTSKIAYTGDLRLHGFRSNETIKFCEKAKNVDALIIEGVSISFDDDSEVGMTEERLINEIVKIVEANPEKQMTFNIYPANLERLLNIIEKVPRTVVIHASMALLIKQFFGKECHYYYLPDDQLIDSLNSENQIDYFDILADESEYFWQIKQDFDKLKNYGVYIHSNAQPLGPFDPAYVPFVEEFEKKHIEFISLSCSGHAYPSDLNKIVELIQPNLLIPIHSLHPERLDNPYGERLLPYRNQVIYL